MSRPRFVGVDGEGMSVDGEQEYVLLTVGEESLIDTEGLGSREIFAFLLDQARPDRRYVGFGLAYDINCWLRDVPEEPLRQIAEGYPTYVTWGPVWYLVHWKPKVSFALAEVRRFHVCDPILGVDREYHEPQRRLCIWDTLELHKSSFVSALDDWRIGSSRERADIRAMKAERAQFALSGWDRVERYNRLECRLLAEMTTAVVNAGRAIGPRVTRYNSPAPFAERALQAHAIPELDYGVPKEWDRAAYYGARSHLCKVGWIGETCYTHDLISAYPTAMTTLPPLPDMWESYEGCSPGWVGVEPCEMVWPRLHPYGISRVRWRLPDGATWGPFPVRDGKRHLHWPVEGEGIYHNVLVQTAMSLHRGEAIQVIEAIRPCYERFDAPNIGGRFAAARQMLRDLRTSAEAQGLYGEAHLWKTAAASMYGKLAQGEYVAGRRPKWKSYYAAGYVTAWTHAQVYGLAMRTPEHVIGFGTDAVWATTPLIPYVLHVQSNFPEPPEWRRIPHRDGLWLQSGVYAVWDEQKNPMVVLRGFGQAKPTADALLAAWRADGTSGALGVLQTRFLGLRRALHEGRMADWRSWETKPRLLTFSPSIGLEGRCLTDEPGERVEWLQQTQEENCWYEPKKSGMDLSLDMLLALEEEYDQPDPLGE